MFRVSLSIQSSWLTCWGQHLRFDFNLGVTPQRLVRVVSHFIAGLFGGPVPAPEWEPSERSVGLCEGGLERFDHSSSTTHSSGPPQKRAWEGGR